MYVSDPAKEQARAADRFWSKVEKTDGCWEFRGYVRSDGYGQVCSPHFQSTLAHRISWELEGHEIGPHVILDHMCKNRACVKPEHLMSVTHGENSSRAGKLNPNARKTHCPQGHEYTESNTFRDRRGSRHCKSCAHAARAERRRRAAV